MRLLDLFCGAGGAAMGYHRAGFDVVGVDIAPQPHYPFEFWPADVMLLDLGMMGYFGLIHASPPCQRFSRAGRLREAQGGQPSTGDLLTPMLERLRAQTVPWVVENVPGAPMEPREGEHLVTLCGSMFGLKVRRHRLFLASIPLAAPGSCRHKEQGRPVGVYHVMGDEIPSGGRTARTLEEGQEAMGIDWMTWAELKESIPPAYTEHIGSQLIAALQERGPT